MITLDVEDHCVKRGLSVLHGEPFILSILSRREFLEVLPTDVGFCHDTVVPDFRDGRAILDTLLELASDHTKLRSTPMMQVVFYKGRRLISHLRGWRRDLNFLLAHDLLSVLATFSRNAPKRRSSCRRSSN